MKNIFELKDIVWFLMGWLIPEMVKRIVKLFSKRKMTNEIKKTNEKVIESEEAICPLAHGTPFFDNASLSLGMPAECFYFSMPSKKHEAICMKNQDFEHTKWDSKCFYWDKEDDTELISAIENVTKDISKVEIREMIEIKKEEIADLFLKRTTEAFFNGEMYGIREIMDRRVGDKEEVKIETKSIKTDYYTHRVMAAVYQQLVKDGKIDPPTSMKDINNYYPFLTSMGMDVLLMIENGSKVVVTKRSKKLINMEDDKWHLSANEAISITDLLYGGIDLEGCVKRGLKEELGLDCNKYSGFSLHYSDVFFLKNPIEVGILALVSIKDLTESAVRESYCVAPDAPFESTGNDETGLVFLPFSKEKIEFFCQTNDVTDAARYALKMLCVRKKQL